MFMSLLQIFGPIRWEGPAMWELYSSRESGSTLSTQVPTMREMVYDGSLDQSDMRHKSANSPEYRTGLWAS